MNSLEIARAFCIAVILCSVMVISFVGFIWIFVRP